MNIITKNLIIKRSVCFEEPLQDMKLVEEETAKSLPLSDEDSGDENESLCSNISDVMYDMSENDISGSESYPNEPTNLPKWAEKTLSFARSNIGNPVDPRKTRGDYQSEGISLYCADPLLSYKCYLIFLYYPK